MDNSGRDDASNDSLKNEILKRKQRNSQVLSHYHIKEFLSDKNKSCYDIGK